MLWHYNGMARKKETAAHKKLAAELIDLIPDIDDEGLAFLIEQARVHVYNCEVERLHEAQEKVVQSSKQRSAVSASRQKKGESLAAGFVIKKSAGGGCYHLGLNGNWKTFSDDEMLSLVRIVNASRPQSEVCADLFAWIERERPDMFPDFEIRSASDPVLLDLLSFLKRSFAIRQG